MRSQRRLRNRLRAFSANVEWRGLDRDGALCIHRRSHRWIFSTYRCNPRQLRFSLWHCRKWGSRLQTHASRSAGRFLDRVVDLWLWQPRSFRQPCLWKQRFALRHDLEWWVVRVGISIFAFASRGLRWSVDRNHSLQLQFTLVPHGRTHLRTARLAVWRNRWRWALLHELFRKSL